MPLLRHFSHCLPLLAAGLLGPLGASAAPVTISTEVVVGPGVPHVNANGAYFLDASEPLTITPTGLLHAPISSRGWAIQLNGDVVNRGVILSGFGLETFGLYLNGMVSNRNYIEASTLNVNGTLVNGALINSLPIPTLITGAHTIPILPAPITYVDVFRADLQQGFGIGPNGKIENRSQWTSYAHGSVYGILENHGNFESRNNPVTDPSPVFGYSQTIEVGDFGANGGLIDNRETGTFLLNFGSRLQLNNGMIDNRGTMTVGAGAEIKYAGLGFVTNQETGIMDMHGHLQMDPGAVFINTGRFNLKSGGTFTNNGSVFQNSRSLTGAAGIFEMDAGASVQQGSGSTFDNHDGTLIVRGSFTGGFVTNSSEIQILNGATMEVASLTQTQGLLVVNGTLTSTSGIIFLQGGRLEGTGIINGTSFWTGTAGAPQAKPFCFLIGYACLRPGNSPGHLEVHGDLNFGEASVLELEIGRNALGELVWDTVTADNITFGQGSVIEVVLGAGVGDLDGRSLQFLTCRQACTFGDATVSVLGGDGKLEWEQGALLFSAAPVPEPETWGLTLAGLAVVAAVARRRRARGA